MRSLIRWAAVGVVGVLGWACPAPAAAPAETVRFVTFNVEDLRAGQVADPESEKVAAIIGVIQQLKPHVLLLKEVETDQGSERGLGWTASRLAERITAAGWTMRAFVRESNTGVHSGFDLDNNGVCDPNSTGRDYAGDCLGYGEFPGHYGMALLIHESVRIDEARVRTFRRLLWKDIPGALLPPADGEGSGGGAWYTDEELAVLPLSSKSHWDVPVVLPDGRTVHVLASHPTPPVFDGPEDRNGRRNHDEIRFWSDYLSTGKSITDDAGRWGPLPGGSLFVIMGDLNADPARGDSLDDPIGKWLLGNARVQGDIVPQSRVRFRKLQPDMTAVWGMRVDYTLPSVGLEVVGAGVWRGPGDTPASAGPQANDPAAALDPFPSDHFPVWVEVRARPMEQEQE